MRDGSGNKLSPEEQQKVKSIQGAPKDDSMRMVSVDPRAQSDTGEADKPPISPRLPPGLRGEE